MEATSSFRCSLLLRILALAPVGVALLPPTASCTGGDGGGSPDAVEMTRCLDWPNEQSATASGGGAAGTAPDGGAPSCPGHNEALGLLEGNCGLPITILSDGKYNGGQCCYLVRDKPYCGDTGRPFVRSGQIVTAEAEAHAGAGWGRPSLRPDLRGLSAAERATLAAAWARDGLLEHASIASFGRFALELLAAGAPAVLVELAHRAAIDEVRHAEMSFALASAYAGEPIAPTPFPFGGQVEVDHDLVSLAARTAREACIGETIAAIQAAEQHAAATDPAVRELLTILAADEARHAELAWRTVAWAIATGGARVRDAVRAVFAEPLVIRVDTAEDPVLAAHGRLGGAAMNAALTRAIEEVIGPASRTLLA